LINHLFRDFMRIPVSHFQKSLREIHRRWMWIRAFERVAMCLLIACGVALGLSIILISRGESALSLTLVCLAGGLLLGAGVGWIVRPNLFDTAVEVDRQLHLADLLATALSIEKRQTVSADSFDQQWSTTILAMAEARCASIENESLVLRRLGAGAWGGVGLFAALVLTIGFLSANPLIPQAMGFSPDASVASESQKSKLAGSSDRVVDPKDNADAESSEHSRMGMKTESASPGESEGRSLSENFSSAHDRGGDGSARTNEASTNKQDLAGASEAGSSQAGVLANGGGRGSEMGRPGNDSSSGAAGASVSHVAAAWKSDGWPAARERAEDEVRGGQVPDAYRDLVRDYFDRKER
jgi:hypothetical protein